MGRLQYDALLQRMNTAAAKTTYLCPRRAERRADAAGAHTLACHARHWVAAPVTVVARVCGTLCSRSASPKATHTNAPPPALLPQSRICYRQNGREAAADDSGVLAAGIIARHVMRIGRSRQRTMTKHPLNGEAYVVVLRRPGLVALCN